MKVQVRVVGKYLEPLKLKLQIAESCKCTFDHLCRPFPTQLYSIQPEPPPRLSLSFLVSSSLFLLSCSPTHLQRFVPHTLNFLYYLRRNKPKQYCMNVPAVPDVSLWIVVNILEYALRLSLPSLVHGSRQVQNIYKPLLHE